MPDPFDPPPERADALRRPPLRPSWRDRLERLADATGTTPARIAAGAVALVGGRGAGPVAHPPGRATGRGRAPVRHHRRDDGAGDLDQHRGR